MHRRMLYYRMDRNKNRGLIYLRDKFPNLYLYRFSYYKPLAEGEQPRQP